MTALRQACAHRFSTYACERGEELASASEVHIVERGPPVFVARIDDERTAICARPGSSEMIATCTCPLFELGLDGCRHLWALVAVLDDACAVRVEPGFDLVPRHSWSRITLTAREPPRAPRTGRRRAARARTDDSAVTRLRRPAFEGSDDDARAPDRRRRG